MVARFGSEIMSNAVACDAAYTFAQARWPCNVINCCQMAMLQTTRQYLYTNMTTNEGPQDRHFKQIDGLIDGGIKSGPPVLSILVGASQVPS